MKTYIDIYLQEFNRDELAEIILKGQQGEWAAELARETEGFEEPISQEEILEWLEAQQDEWKALDSQALDKILRMPGHLIDLSADLAEAGIGTQLVPGVFQIGDRVLAQSKNGLIAGTDIATWKKTYANRKAPRAGLLSDAARKQQHLTGFESHQQHQALLAKIEKARAEQAALATVSVTTSSLAAGLLANAKAALADEINSLTTELAASQPDDHSALVVRQLAALTVH